MLRKSFEKKLIRYTRQFFATHPDVKLIAVTGSAGKMSTKIAIATVLSEQFAVAMREDEPTSHWQVLLQIMGVHYPDIPEKKWNWLMRRRMLRAVKRRAHATQADAQVIVQEFSSMEVGFLAWFADVVLPDIAVITSVTSGRMQVAYPVEQVAQEVLTLANNARFAMINRDDIDGRFAAFLTNPQMTTYGTNNIAEYYFDEQSFSLEDGHKGLMISPEYPEGFAVTARLLGVHNVRPAVAAMAVAVKLQTQPEVIARGIARLASLPGRMRILRGAVGTTLIDDTYSSSPLTAQAALQTLYSLEAPQRIAVFGTMNGLHQEAGQAHAELGSQCSPTELDWVVTVGNMANQFLAPAARQQGCQVKACHDALEAGAFVRDKLRPGCIVLFKGSSGGVWLEEAIKINLHSIRDERLLVRQSKQWLAKKDQFFSRFGD